MYGVAKREVDGVLVRSVAQLGEWWRWDGGHWGGWRAGSPRTDKEPLSRGQERGRGHTPGSAVGLGYRTAPAGWCHAPRQAQVAPLVTGPRVEEGEREGEAGESGEGVSQVRASQSLSLRVRAEVGGEGEGELGGEDGDMGSACFGQVSRRLGRLLRRLPKSRSWSDGLRMLRRTSSNGSLINSSSGMEGGREGGSKRRWGMDRSVRKSGEKMARSGR